MEDEGFVDDDFIDDTARRYVALHGAACLNLLRERARIAAAAGDYLVAQTWQEIVAAARDMLGAEFVGDAE